MTYFVDFGGIIIFWFKSAILDTKEVLRWYRVFLTSFVLVHIKIWKPENSEIKNYIDKCGYLLRKNRCLSFNKMKTKNINDQSNN